MTEPALDTLSTAYFPAGPVSLEFLKCESFIAAIKGPIGSGKSVTCVMKILRNAQMQPIAKDGYRHSRYAIIRNTMPELKSTTMKTWHQWVPKNIGRWVGQGPPTHHIIDHVNKINMEVMFVALDSPDDVKKVLSMELTSAWINEAREVPKAIVDGLTGRVGRFKPDIHDDLFALNPQLILDTNPPESDHWWAVIAENDLSTIFGRQMMKSMMDAEIELREAGLLLPEQKLFEFFNQPGAYHQHAENLDNLRPGYYATAKAGKTEQWIDVYVNGNYGFVQEGRAVYSEYNDQLHCKPIEKVQGVKVQIGLDFGLRPAAIFAQHTPEGQWRIYSEICGEGMNLFQFADAIKQHVSEEYRGFTIGKITGDPYGDNRSPTDKQTRTTFQILASLNIFAVSSPDKSNDIIRRLAAVQAPLGKLVNGEPAVIIDPAAAILRKGMAGGYAYKRVKVSGDERYHDTPDKNRYSDPCDAMQYLFMGGGEYDKIIDVGNNQMRPEVLETYEVMDGVM
jgi:hypothetical protein